MPELIDFEDFRDARVCQLLAETLALPEGSPEQERVEDLAAALLGVTDASTKKR